MARHPLDRDRPAHDAGAVLKTYTDIERKTGQAGKSAPVDILRRKADGTTEVRADAYMAPDA